MAQQSLKDFLSQNQKVLSITIDYQSSTLHIEPLLINSGERDNINLSVDREYTPTPKDKIYIYPESGVPRFKVKEYCVKNKISLVKDFSRANAKFLNVDNFINKRIETKYFIAVRKNVFINFLNRNTGHMSKDNEEVVRNDNTGIYLISNYYYHHFEYNRSNIFKSTLPSAERDVKFSLNPAYESYMCQISVIKPECLLELEDVSNDNTLHSHQELVLKLSSGMVFDATVYKDIKRLFESTDKNNHVLAMEAMANSDFRLSAVYLLLLFKEYGNEIYAAPNRNHVNFKALRSYFEIDKYVDLDGIVTRLKNKGLDSKENLNLLIPEIITQLNEDKNIHNFTVTQVEYNGEEQEEIFEDSDEENESEPIVLERDDQGNPLMSATMVLMDLGNSENQSNGGQNTPGT